MLQIRAIKKAVSSIPSDAPPEVTPENTAPPRDEFFFQAIGVIRGKIVERGDRCVAIVGGKEFRLVGRKLVVEKCLKTYPDQDQELYLKVYPRMGAGNKLEFTLIGFQSEPFKDPDRTFVIAGNYGIYKGSRFLRIFRNECGSAKAWYQCVPIIWKDCDLEENAKVFVQAICKFSPTREKFMVVMAKVTDSIPRYKKIIKPHVQAKLAKKKAKAKVKAVQSQGKVQVSTNPAKPILKVVS